MSFADKVVMVTGASSGMGEALVRELAQQRAKLGLIARREAQLQSLTQEIIQQGGCAEYMACDVSDRDKIVPAIRELEEKLGPIDLLIANAGVGNPVTLEPFNVDEMERILRINYFGVLYCIEAVLPSMLARKCGHISAIASLAAYKGMPGEQAYSASKAAVSNFMEGLRIQLRDKGIAVTTICPGFVYTPMVAHFGKMPFALNANVAARKMLRALRRKKKVFNFPRSLTWAIKLGRILPDWLVNKLVTRVTDQKQKNI